MSSDLPAIPDELKESVALVCYKEGRRLRVAGATCFFGLEVGDQGKTFAYAIAPRRAIELVLRRGYEEKAYVRVNVSGGAATFLKVDARQWRFHPTDDSVDVAVLPWTTPEGRMDFRMILSGIAATEEVIQREGIGVADEVLLTGVFASHFGPKRNLPIVRKGSIAMMSDGPVRTEDVGDIEAHLIEVGSYGGLVGSPVFVRRNKARNGKKDGRAGSEAFRLLGLVRGPWRLPISYSDLVIEERQDGDNFNTGIVVVVPATKILEVFDHPDLKLIRDREERVLTGEPTPLEALEPQSAPE